MKWKEEYATGLKTIDDQHRMIFKMSEDFRSSLDEGGGANVYITLLDSLTLYCEGHFGFEEDCMNKYECPVAKKNKDAHVRFGSTLSDFQQRFKQNGYNQTDARSLVDTMDLWLADHICNIDIHLRECVT